MPKVKKDVDEHLKNEPIKAIVTKEKIDELLNQKTSGSAVSEKEKELHENLRNRNKGKQQKHHK